MATSSGRLGARISLVLFGVLLGLLLSSFLDTSGLVRTPHEDRQVVKLAQFSIDCKAPGDRVKSQQGPKGELPARDNILSRSYGKQQQPRSQTRSLIKGEKPRKIFIDCGANAAFSVRLFRETYPGGQDYVIHSFELDQRLIPYFSPYSNHVLHCPVAAADRNGNITVYGESVWRPDKGRVFDMDMQWGGGVVYADENETRSESYGRRFGVKTVVPMLDLSSWVQENTVIEDHVILKIDVEGSEYEIVEKMLKDGTFKWIDKFYAEFHNVSWAPVPGWSQQRRDDLVRTLEKQGNMFLYWEGESHYYQDMEELHKPDIPATTPGAPGTIYSQCSRSPGGGARLALTVQVGMDAKVAFRLVETMRAHPSNMPVALFVHGNFAQLYPDLVSSWAETYIIGIREVNYVANCTPWPANSSGMLSVHLSNFYFFSSDLWILIEAKVDRLFPVILHNRGLRCAMCGCDLFALGNNDNIFASASSGKLHE
ncbi:Hypp3940 [Branchiostoma lanceolatum]|uniref:Hypp3940 protein n=1 Tax=Branchiostoma lanceolatum TaxID=7740 RepID=A0A8K0A3L4_BRALA|nr:Hypp3940 [Branchiostoma lanceolatum]